MTDGTGSSAADEYTTVENPLLPATPGSIHRASSGGVPLLNTKSLYLEIRKAQSGTRARSASRAAAAVADSKEALESLSARPGEVPLDETPDDEQHNRFLISASFVKDAVEGRGIRVRQDPTVNVSLRNLIARRSYRVFIQLVMFVLMLLAFWEGNGFAFGTNEVEPWVPYVEIACLFVATVDLVLQLQVFGKHLVCGEDGFLTCGSKKWETVNMYCLIIAWLDFVLYYGAQAYDLPRLSRALRPFMLVAKKKDVRRLLSTISHTLPRLADIVAMTVLLIVFFAVLGFNLFSKPQLGSHGYSETNDNFDHFASASLSVYVLTTTENYPAVMYPAYNIRPQVTVIFFASAIFAFMWVILPVVLAVVYDVYLENKSRIETDKRVREHKAMIAAYHVLLDNPRDPIDVPFFRRFMRFVNPTLTQGTVDSLFLALDQNESGRISIREWLALPDLLRTQRRTRIYSDQADFERDEETDRVLWCCLRVSKAECSRYFVHWATKVVQREDTVPHKVWKYTYFGTVIANQLLACAWDANDQITFDRCRSEHGLSECTHTAVFALEMCELLTLVMLAFVIYIKSVGSEGGFARWWSIKWSKFDVIALLWSLTTTTLQLSGVRTWGWPLIWVDLVEASRSFRVLFVISTFDRFRHFVDLVESILRLLLQFLWSYACVTYSFAVVGMWLFGGVPNGQDLTDSEQYSFQSFGRAVLVLTQLTVGNDWNSVMYPNITATSRWFAFYFVLYFALCTTIGLNVITGVIVDEYQAAQKQRATEEVARRERSETVARRRSTLDGSGASAVEMRRVSSESRTRAGLDGAEARDGMPAPLRRDLTRQKSRNMVADLHNAGDTLEQRESLAFTNDELHQLYDSLEDLERKLYSAGSSAPSTTRAQRFAAFRDRMRQRTGGGSASEHSDSPAGATTPTRRAGGSTTAAPAGSPAGPGRRTAHRDPGHGHGEALVA